MVIVNVLKRTANLIKRVANWILAKKFYAICVGIILAELVFFGVYIKVKGPAAHEYCMENHKNEVGLVLIRDDPAFPHCNCPESCWTKVGVNKLCGCEIYLCEVCDNYVEPVNMGDGNFERLTFLDYGEVKERLHP